MPIGAAEITEVAYQAYRAYAQTNNLSVPTYANLPAALVTEYEAAVDDVIADDTVTGAAIHQAIVVAREADDWVYGLNYNATAKTDPLLIDFDAIPIADRTWFNMLAAVAVAMTEFEGFDAPA